MALDGIFLYSIIEELKTKLINGKVDKINQPEKDEIIMSVRSDRYTYKLLISASSIYPKIHITDSIKQNPITAPMFCMVLRKYLNNAHIVDIRQKNSDRICIIDFESLDELGFNSIYSLIIEIMGRHSNITLVRQRDNVIMDSIKHITPDINTYRSLYSGLKYIFPPESTKLNPLELSYENFNNYIIANEISFNQSFFSKVFTGVGAQLSKEMFFRMKDLTLDNIQQIYNETSNIFSSLEDRKFDFIMYYNNESISEFYCLKLLSADSTSMKTYSSPSKLVEDFYLEKDKQDRLNSKSSDLQKIINTNIERCTKKITLLQGTLDECKDKDNFKIFGELLTANIYSIKKGQSEACVLNYYSNNGDNVCIKLDINKTPSENIQSYYKKYNKLKKSEEMANIQLKNSHEELDYLQSVLTNIKNADSYEVIEEIRGELVETGYIKFKKTSKKKTKATKPMHFISSDGIDIYVGKNNLQNDYLTLKFAEKHDLWLHTKNIPGSHVIVKTFGDPPETTLMEAANLAALYSKGKDSSKVPVDYTEVKNVKKPSGAKPGMVIYYTNKTIYVTPENLKLKKIE